MNNNKLISIGLPVFNGADFLAESIKSLLNQTYTNFELIISDNASTDRTQEICKSYRSVDNRLRYFRNSENVGAAKNFNKVFQLSRGEYFKWATHDDLCAPTFLEKCVEILEKDKSIIGCYSRVKEINKYGKIVINYPSINNLDLLKPKDRFHEALMKSKPGIPIFGLLRTDALKKTRLIGGYSSSDRILLAELVLIGRLYEIPEFLFFRRNHPKQHVWVYPNRYLRQRWFDPSIKRKIIFPHWRLLFEYFISIERSSINWDEKVMCWIYLFSWINQFKRNLCRDLLLRSFIKKYRKGHKKIIIRGDLK